MKERNNVNKIREGHLMSKMELARLAGVSSATIDRIEHGETCRKGNILETCAILTTTANRLMAPLHDRMPVCSTLRDSNSGWTAPRIPRTSSNGPPNTTFPNHCRNGKFHQS